MKAANVTQARKWRDPDGNVYGVEQLKTKRFIVIRTNAGGNRKAAKQMFPVGNATYVQKELDSHAEGNGRTEVPQ